MSRQIINADNLNMEGLSIEDSSQNVQPGLVQLANIIGENVGGSPRFGRCSIGTNIIAVSAESYFRIYEYKNNEIQYTGFEITAETGTTFVDTSVSGNDQFIAITVITTSPATPKCINIYSYSGSSFSLLTSLTKEDIFSESLINFTHANLDYSGERLCVLAPGMVSKSAVLKRTGTSFTKELDVSLGQLLAVGPIKLSRNGDVVVIGNPMATVSDILGSGEAYVYTRTDTTWTLKATLRPDTPVFNKWFGTVSLSDDGTQVVAGCVTGSSAYELLTFHSSDGWATNLMQPITVPNIGSGRFAYQPEMINNEFVVDMSRAYMSYRNFGGRWEPSSSIPVQLGTSGNFGRAAMNKKLIIVGDLEYSGNRGQIFVYARSSKPQIIANDVDISSGYTIASGVNLVTIGTGGSSVDINLPLFPSDGDEVSIVFNVSSTSITIKGSTNLFDAGSGTAVVSASYSAGDIVRFRFVYATGLWYKV
jgi:hypothetical protein